MHRSNSKVWRCARLQVGSGADGGELRGERGDAGALGGHQLRQHKVQQRGAPVSALHVCQLQQRVQPEACRAGQSAVSTVS